MLAAADDYSTPAQEFGFGRGSATTELLEAEFAASNRKMAERRRQNAEKKRIAEVRGNARQALEAADRALEGRGKDA